MAWVRMDVDSKEDSEFVEKFSEELSAYLDKHRKNTSQPAGSPLVGSVDPGLEYCRSLMKQGYSEEEAEEMTRKKFKLPDDHFRA